MATLYVLDGPDKGKTFRFAGRRAVLGRVGVTIQLQDGSISRRHAEVVPENGQWRLNDLGSSNGTYLNGLRLEQATVLKPGDEIRMGKTMLVFGADDFSGSAVTINVGDLIDFSSPIGTMETSMVQSLPSDEDSRLLAESRRTDAIRGWRMMYEIAEAIGATPDIDQLLALIMDIIFEHMEVDRGFILLSEEGPEALEPKVAKFRYRSGEGERIATSQTIINHVMEQCESVLCTNAMTDQRFQTEGDNDSIHRFSLKSVLCVPIVARGAIHGIIHLDCAMSTHVYSGEHLRLANAVGHMTGMAVENARLMESRVQNERLAAAGETAAYLSHHIKNILQGLRSAADIVEIGLKRDALDTVKRGWLAVEDALEMIFHLTLNMLTFSKDREPNLVMTQINTVVQKAIDLTRRRAEVKKVRMEVTLEELPSVPIDRDGVQQLTLNLINNAIDAVEPEKGVIGVHSRYNGDQDLLVITVTDNGSGIDPELVAQAFQPFQSTKGQAGTGLGLAAAKKIVDEHGGNLVVEHHVPCGTSFHAQFPVKRLAGEPTLPPGP